MEGFRRKGNEFRSLTLRVKTEPSPMENEDGTGGEIEAIMILLVSPIVYEAFMSQHPIWFFFPGFEECVTSTFFFSSLLMEFISLTGIIIIRVRGGGGEKNVRFIF